MSIACIVIYLATKRISQAAQALDERIQYNHLSPHNCREQHGTKNLPKTATNCTQITLKIQRQPHVEVSEVYSDHINNFISAF